MLILQDKPLIEIDMQWSILKLDVPSYLDKQTKNKLCQDK